MKKIVILFLSFFTFLTSYSQEYVEILRASDNNILVNIANIAHDDNEVMNYDIKEYNFI